MAKVRGPNGMVLDLPDAVASGLVGSRDHGFEYVAEDKPAVRRSRVEGGATGARKRRATGSAARGTSGESDRGGSSASDDGS